MLPPVEEAVLQNNPKFADLYKKLSTNILNPNGSTKNHPAQKERDIVSATLKTARIEAAKSQILVSSLSSLDLSPPPPIPAKPRTRTSQAAPPRKAAELPDELVELIILLTANLSLPLQSRHHIARIHTDLPFPGHPPPTSSSPSRAFSPLQPTPPSCTVKSPPSSPASYPSNPHSQRNPTTSPSPASALSTPPRNSSNSTTKPQS
ncbi:65a9f061-6c76-4623-bbe2-759ed9fbf349 [Sclerotinia trifoliorum]|uniref:65a9f061-6c76-4623-bbe2-759ed9fbf349 n=1 Tax=Sclerotinia trifoliorum TaxID=28548 RepID=A0A8H2ZUG3_9HELO|nr:65a9f061-6c76-4623-bbe2-759ed9fbf349 [Sclerotinia trifoliorum]